MPSVAILFALLPVLATALNAPSSSSSSSGSTSSKPSSTLPFTNNLCNTADAVLCPLDAQLNSRCINLNGKALCLTVCPSSSTCPADCKAQAHKNGFCSNGAEPCICTDRSDEEVTTPA
ncbi:hypothetical protein LX32DRAFT_707166 [Colletotrichum zoysiae]|uniref:Biotrophy-associated secreted protein 3 n=1 Tax=Colletotrichum zoysiae TaxID=1216348 RepID=A0AAD9H775_9PEZI|nr:hypothetical protein LX32DRAFT_707166 [Colletotrichum zoysiae]